MSRLKNLYTHLVRNRRHVIDGWLKHYVAFTSEIEKIRIALKTGHGIRDPQTYVGTSFEKASEPFQVFAEQLLYQQSNGISSRGQSILAWEDFESFIKDDTFVAALQAVITEPRFDNFQHFRERWSSFAKGERPLLVNRVLAACTLDVSTTVHESKFFVVYNWLVAEGLVPPPDPPSNGWYTANIHLMSVLHDAFKDELAEHDEDVSPYLLSIFVWELFEHISKPFSLKKQVVRYGPPGTGKTHVAKENAELLFKIWQAEFGPRSTASDNESIATVQFHPSYTYEDFMEGLRPILLDDGQVRLRLQNGIFKDLCKRAGRWEVDVWRHVSKEKALNWENLTIGELLPHREKLPSAQWSNVFAHDQDKKVADAVPPYFLIIDEMNRAELSRVLGELMFCLEYRGVGGAVQTQYAMLNDDTTAMIGSLGGYQFFVPHNVYIIGTMNTIDRSVESFDFALRRRFRWEEVAPDTGVLRYHLEQTQRGHWLGIAANLDGLNQAICDEPLLGRDYQIGHAYLMKLKYPPALTLAQLREAVWEDGIKPLLEEYLRGTGKTNDLMETFEKGFGIR